MNQKLQAASLYYVAADLVETVGEAIDVVVGNADKTEEDYASHTDEERGASVAIALEGGEGLVIGLDIHGLYDEQVVVE